MTRRRAAGATRPAVDDVERVRALLARLDARGCESLPQAVLDGTRAIVGDLAMVDKEPLAKRARAKIVGEKGWPTAKEYQALVTVLLAWRPVVSTFQGIALPLPGHLDAAFPGWQAFRDAVGDGLRAVGRVQRFDAAAQEHRAVGTAFVVRPGWVATARHVVTDLKGEAGWLAWDAEEGAAGRVVALTGEARTPADPDVDVALLRVDGATPGALPLDEAPLAPDDDLAVAGYPMRDERSLPAQQAIFGAFPKYAGPRRVAPGQVVRVEGSALVHDASTLGGNSGSPVFRQATGGVVAVHNGGERLLANVATLAAIVRELLP